MTRDELHDMIDWLDSQQNNAAARTAEFLRQIADARPDLWAWQYSNGTFSSGAFKNRRACELNTLPNVPGQPVALYRLPLED